MLKTRAATNASNRKIKGLSQEKVAEYVGVSRQAVTKWENGVSNPNSENLIKLSELLQVDVEVLLGRKDDGRKHDNVSMGKGPALFCVFSLISILCYCIYSVVMGQIQVGALICMIIIAVPIQLFMNVYFSNAIKNESYSGIAGFSDKIEYRSTEVKKLLVEINTHIGRLSTVCIMFMCVGNSVYVGNVSLSNLLLFLYIVEFAVTILILNYRAISHIYCNDKDRQRAKLSFPIICIYLFILIAGIIETFILFEINNIENNSVPALKIGSVIILAAAFSTIGFMKESSRINKSDVDKEKYVAGRFAVISVIVTIICYVVVPFVI